MTDFSTTVFGEKRLGKDISSAKGIKVGLQQEVEYTKDPRKFPYDLTTQEGKADFEDEIKAVNAKHPGLVALKAKASTSRNIMLRLVCDYYLPE